jgi:hypothetical protein
MGYLTPPLEVVFEGNLIMPLMHAKKGGTYYM